MNQTPELSYPEWFAELQKLALEQEIDWLVSENPQAHQDAFERGATPEEELASLRDFCEWRGCGCGKNS